MEHDSFDAKEIGASHLDVDCRKKVRDQLQSEVEAFLAKGGEIQKVDRNVSGDPPQKPENSYTSRSI